MSMNAFLLRMSVFCVLLAFLVSGLIVSCQNQSGSKADVRAPLGYYFDIGDYRLSEVKLILDSLLIDRNRSRKPNVKLLAGEQYELIFFGSFTVLETGINYPYIDTVLVVGGDPKPIVVKVVEGRK